MVYNLDWSLEAECLTLDERHFFEWYENGSTLASMVDKKYCNVCPVQQTCLAIGAARKEWGVWGGIYLEDGQISEEHNQHKTEDDWKNLWLRLTTLMQ